MAFHDEATVEVRDCCPCPLPGKPLLLRVSVLPAALCGSFSSGSSAKEPNNDNRPAVAVDVLGGFDSPPYLMEARRAGLCFGIGSQKLCWYLSEDQVALFFANSQNLENIDLEEGDDGHTDVED